MLPSPHHSIFTIRRKWDENEIRKLSLQNLHNFTVTSGTENAPNENETNLRSKLYDRHFRQTSVLKKHNQSSNKHETSFLPGHMSIVQHSISCLTYYFP